METDPLREAVYFGTVCAGTLGGSGGGVEDAEAADSVDCGEIVSRSNPAGPEAKDVGSSLTPPSVAGWRPYCAPARRRSEAPVGLR